MLTLKNALLLAFAGLGSAQVWVPPPCKPSAYDCDFESGIIWVCDGNKNWQLSADCGGGGCCQCNAWNDAHCIC